MPLSNTKVLVQVRADITKSLDLKTATSILDFARGLAFADGTIANQANLLWDDRRSIAASGTDDLDLNGSLTDAVGQPTNFVRIKAVVVAADSGNTNNVVIGNHPTAAFVGPFGAATHTASVQPGGIAVFVTPGATAWPVTATTADILRIANSAGGTSVTYDIVLIGASA